MISRQASIIKLLFLNLPVFLITCTEKRDDITHNALVECPISIPIEELSDQEVPDVALERRLTKPVVAME